MDASLGRVFLSCFFFIFIISFCWKSVKKGGGNGGKGMLGREEGESREGGKGCKVGGREEYGRMKGKIGTRTERGRETGSWESGLGKMDVRTERGTGRERGRGKGDKCVISEGFRPLAGAKATLKGIEPRALHYGKLAR